MESYRVWCVIHNNSSKCPNPEGKAARSLTLSLLSLSPLEESMTQELMFPKKPGTAIRHRKTPSTHSETRYGTQSIGSRDAAGAKWFSP